jgi:hypothetical protein
MRIPSRGDAPKAKTDPAFPPAEEAGPPLTSVEGVVQTTLMAPESVAEEIREKKKNPALYESELFQAPSETDSNGS